jgi:hypothetical protein
MVEGQGSKAVSGHQCFGCRRPIQDGEPHIHVPLDEWAERNGLTRVGMDALLGDFVFCQSCTEESKHGGWMLERHGIGR